MGRTEPCILYAHTFVHPHLDEYVDEVLFSEPVVITACEFLEQNASSICPAVKLIGATAPPSFALEVFIQCEGETRFRRLCMPCLYSHSSSNILEVEAVVTSHLVVRGSYRSLSMVLYGNTAEDLGQFNIEVDLDTSLTDTVGAIEGNMEDLPPAFRPSKLIADELVLTPNILNEEAIALDIPIEVRKYLQRVLQTLESKQLEVTSDEVLSSLLAVASYYKPINLNQHGIDGLRSSEDICKILSKIEQELPDNIKNIQSISTEESLFQDSEFHIPTSKEFLDILQEHFNFFNIDGDVGYPHFSQNMNTVLWLSIARLLCSGRKSCSYFINYGGMKQLGILFTQMRPTSTTLKLLFLGVIEQATCHSIGCEGFLGWWPRESESIPSGTSDGYNQVLKLLLENQRHDVASLATYILHRIRFYEVACKYEFTVLSILGCTSAHKEVANFTLDMLTCAQMHLKTLMKLIKLSGPIDDPSPRTAASRYFIPGDAGVLTYKATSAFINTSKCCFSNVNIDSHLLSLLKERGFLPLSAALLSSSILRSETGRTADLLVDVLLHIEAIILSLLFCRPGVAFLMNEPDVCSTVIRVLRGADDFQVEDSISLRYATVLISKGFFCHPKEVGTIIEMHARVLISVDRLSKLTPNTEEFLWVLWDLCRLSRSECGRQALFVLINIPEAVAILMSALHSGGEIDELSSNTGLSPLNLAIVHSAAEIFEVIVSDSTATSLASWIDKAKELHRALTSSSPGSNVKDAPARLLEWIDAGVVYHRNGAVGLVQYAAVLTSGGDAHMASNSVLASEMMDVDNILGDSSSTADGNIVDNLIGKRITEKDFPGVILRDSSVIQLTTAFRILAFVSDNSVVAAALYDEGAVMVIHAVLINCKLMLERSSNIYDFLVDEGIEGNSTSDLLLERSREKSLLDLLIPALVLLVNLLQKLKDSKEQHRNTKLMNALLQLHREVSLKLAACSADINHSCPDFSLGYGAVCHLLASSLSCWPVYNWTPGLFHFLLDSMQATSLLVMGTKEICSLFCLLNDLLPDESIWLWKNGRPTFSFLRALSVGTILGPQKDEQINWYTLHGHPEKLIAQLSPQLAKLGEIILHCSISMLIIIQDILRVFIIRVACLNIDFASELLKPILSWISHCLSDLSTLSDVDAYKVHQLLNFLSILLEHPLAKPLLLRDGGFEILAKAFDICIEAANSDVKSPLLSWCIPLFSSLSLINDGRTYGQHRGLHDRNFPESLTAESRVTSLSYLLRFSMILPVGRELFACLSAFKEISSSVDGPSVLVSLFTHIQSLANETCESQMERDDDAKHIISNVSEWKEHAPLLCCWNTLLSSISAMDVPVVHIATAIEALSVGALNFCMDGESLNWARVTAIKYLFGFKNDNLPEGFIKESLKNIEDLTNFMESGTSSAAVKDTANLLLQLLQKSPGSGDEDATIARSYASWHPPSISSKIQRIADRTQEIEEQSLDEFGAKFSWECPENLRDRLSQAGLPAKRKISMEGQTRRSRGDASVPEATAQSSFSKGSVPLTTPSGPTRRDNFRQRKPNTSRPPSMHVDDYVARERNADGTNSSNVIAVPRIGSSSGRPPSIHVDEFMARQKERQNVAGISVTDAATQVKASGSQNNNDSEKSRQPQQLKPDLDDDLHGIDIVFDAEESDPDDKLSFPHPDDTLPSTSVVEQRSPHSIVEETENDATESATFSSLGTPLASTMDENVPSEFSSRTSGSRPEMPLTREPSISSEKQFSGPSQDSKSFPLRIPVPDSSEIAGSSGFPGSVYMSTPASTVHFNTLNPPNLYSKVNPPQSRPVSLATGPQGYYESKFSPNQPPLPPPPIMSSMPQNIDPIGSKSSSFFKSPAEQQAQAPPGFLVQSEYGFLSGSNANTSASSMVLPHSKFGRASLSSPSLSSRPPPLPPTPPPYLANISGLPLIKIPTSQPPQFLQPVATSEQQIPIASKLDGGAAAVPVPRSVLSSYPTVPLAQPALFRPGSISANSYAGNVVPHLGDNPPNLGHNLPISLSSVHSTPIVNQLQPPQVNLPPPHHLRPPVVTTPSEHHGVATLKSSLQMQSQPSHALHPQQESPTLGYYQAPQQEHAPGDRSQRNLQLQGDSSSGQQDPGMSLQEYFKSPEAIQSLLTDRDKLCQLLEQHPKLMQMLQERLGRV